MLRRPTIGLPLMLILLLSVPSALQAVPQASEARAAADPTKPAVTVDRAALCRPSPAAGRLAAPSMMERLRELGAWACEPATAASIVSALAAALGTYLACHPILAFRRRGYAIKRNDIFSSLTPQAKMLYMRTFGYETTSDVVGDFAKMYEHRYGRYRLTTPLVLLVLITFPLLYLSCSTGLSALLVETGDGETAKSLGRIVHPALELPSTALAAITGAFLWVVSSLIDGSARYNMPPQSLLMAALRLATSIPLGYAISSIAAPAIAPFIAFAIGAFPLKEVQILFKRIATNKLGLETGADHQVDQVTKLDGIDQPTADRLEDGDVLTIAQLAYCDPVQLSMRTNITFSAIVDAQSQALAWIYLSESLVQLRGIGLRGASEVANLIEDLDSDDAELQDEARRIIAIAAARICVDAEGKPRTPDDALGLTHAFREIAGDPYTEFLVEVWENVGDAPADQDGAVAQSPAMAAPRLRGRPPKRTVAAPGGEEAPAGSAFRKLIRRIRRLFARLGTPAEKEPM